MPHAYTEVQLVEQPAIGLFAELGWTVAGLIYDVGIVGEPRDAGLLGRETKGEVVLVSRLRSALERLNPAFFSQKEERAENFSRIASVEGQSWIQVPAGSNVSALIPAFSPGEKGNGSTGSSVGGGFSGCPPQMFMDRGAG